jgi:hypothetical protein
MAAGNLEVEHEVCKEHKESDTEPKCGFSEIPDTTFAGLHHSRSSAGAK